MRWSIPLERSCTNRNRDTCPPASTRSSRREILTHIPHNQFLGVLVYYGWPGLALLMLFYGVVLFVFLSLIRLALELRTAGPTVLVASLTGCMGAYVCNSLFQPAGPFVGDWYHWIVIGLVFSAHAVLKRSARNSHVLTKSKEA